MKKNITAYILLGPTLILVLAISLFPIFYTIVLSFFSYDWFELKFIGIYNWIKLFKDQDFYSALKVTSIYMISATSIEFLIGFAIAFLLNDDRLKGIRIINTIIISPMMIANVVVGIIWRMFYSEGGLIELVTDFLFPNVQFPIWIASPKYALLSIIIVDVYQATPFFILIIYAGLKSMPREVFEAARVDGASSWSCFRFLTLHFLKTFIFISLIFRTVDLLRVFDKISMLTRGGPAGLTTNISYFIYFEGFVNNHLGYSATAAVVVIIIASIISFIFIRMLKVTI